MLKSFKKKTCPNCKKGFKDKNPNWILLSLIENNNNSNIKNVEPREELKKTLDKSISMKNSIYKEYEKEIEKNDSHYKVIENQIKSQTENIIKSIESTQSKLLIQLKDKHNARRKDLDQLFNDNAFNELIDTAENVLDSNDSTNNLEINKLNKSLTLKLDSLKNKIFENESNSLEFIINTKSLNYRPEFIGRVINRTGKTKLPSIEDLIKE